MAGRVCTVAGVSAVNRAISEFRKKREKGAVTSFVFICQWVHTLFLFIYEGALQDRRRQMDETGADTISIFFLFFSPCKDLQFQVYNVTLSDQSVSRMSRISRPVFLI